MAGRFQGPGNGEFDQAFPNVVGGPPPGFRGHESGRFRPPPSPVPPPRQPLLGGPPPRPGHPGAPPFHPNPPGPVVGGPGHNLHQPGAVSIPPRPGPILRAPGSVRIPPPGPGGLPHNAGFAGERPRFDGPPISAPPVMMPPFHPARAPLQPGPEHSLPRPPLRPESAPLRPIAPMTSGVPTQNIPTGLPSSEKSSGSPAAVQPVSNSDGKGSVPFSNDGSFLERFRAMQQEKQRHQPPSQVPESRETPVRVKEEEEEEVKRTTASSSKPPAVSAGFANDGSFLERFRSMQKSSEKGNAAVLPTPSETSVAAAPVTAASVAHAPTPKKAAALPLKGAMKNKLAMMVAQSKKLQKVDKGADVVDVFEETEDLDGEEMEGETMGQSSATIAAAMRSAEQLAVYVAEGGKPVETMAIKQNQSNTNFWWLYQNHSTPYRHYNAKVTELSGGTVKAQHPLLVLQSLEAAAEEERGGGHGEADTEPPRKKKKRSRWGVAPGDDDAPSHVEASSAPAVTMPASQDSVAALAAYAPPHHSLGTAAQAHSSAAAATSFSSRAAPPPSSYDTGTTKSRSRSGFSGTRPSTKQAIAVIAARVAASQAALAERVKAEKAAEEAEFEALFPQGPEATDHTALQQQLEEQRYLNNLVERYKQLANAAAPPAPEPSSSKKKKNRWNKHEYDSDEDTEGGTWEHKKRREEMEKTADKSWVLTLAGRGKHHIADFLPKEEMEKFFAKVKSIKEGAPFDFSDYAEHRITAENLGYQLLQSAGWEDGQGLGSLGQGIKNPINKGKTSFDQSGMGAEQPGEVTADDDEFDLYRKRMMLAYRFRPNPLNNPRRPYY